MTLAQWLKQQGMSQAAFADLIGSDQGHVSDLVRGKVRPRVKNIEIIARVTKGAGAFRGLARQMRTSYEVLSSVCSEVMNDLFPYEPLAKVDAKVVDDQLYELDLFALRLQQIVLQVRKDGATPKALERALYEVLR